MHLQTAFPAWTAPVSQACPSSRTRDLAPARQWSSSSSRAYLLAQQLRKLPQKLLGNLLHRPVP